MTQKQYDELLIKFWKTKGDFNKPYELLDYKDEFELWYKSELRNEKIDSILKYTKVKNPQKI